MPCKFTSEQVKQKRPLGTQNLSNFSRMFLFFLFFFLLSPSRLSISLTHDGLLLLEARNRLSDPHNSLSTWNRTASTPCRWKGVTCNPYSSAVTAVDLSFSFLSGPFPAVLCRLSSLSSLNLSYNLINSTLSPVSRCPSLRHLDLSQNNLVGPIHSLTALTSLRYLDLSANNLTGEIPESLAALRHLETLNLVSNLLTGTIPASLSNLTSLKHLQLAYNSFRSGPIPRELGNLGNLETLFLAMCNLEGPIPHTFSNLVNLINLDLSQNSITGHIPQWFTRFTRVTQIELYQNSLSGELPRGMSKMTSLKLFDASRNELTGTIPTELCELPLESLNLYENKLEGSLPGVIARSPNLRELKIFSNRLVGTLPSDLGSNSPLNHVDVSFNRFSGEIPANICRQGKLEQLLMIYNSFAGEIPKGLGKCKSLTRVRLRNNNLSGSVPEGFWSLPRLRLLELLENYFSGHISRGISGSSSLSSLLLSNNRFSGSIPEEIGSLDNLLEFAASNNNLSGQIPRSIMKMKQLVNLDLSSNQLSGHLNFAGIGYLSKITDLNLSHNMLDGNVPIELGSWPVLDYLDLSWNNFSGEIPLQLQNLRLSQLNLSYNQLTGNIPPLYAKAEYKTSFIGNPGLCSNLPGLFNCCGRNKNRKYMWILWFIFVLAAVVFIIGVAWFYLRYRKVKKSKKGSWTSSWKSFHKLRFSGFEVVKLLNEANVIGRGASGKVYKAVLSNGEVVAVKKLSGAPAKMNENVGSRKDEFDAEVETLGRIRHRNIVKLWCCCNSGDHKLLVFEYMPNGSLADLLQGNKKSLLDWPTRYKIVVDAAEGLSYLHHDCVPPIVHRDVKSNNILVNEEFVAKVADFGVAKMVTSAAQGESMSVIAGSYGYIAPEYAYTLRVNEKSDIYSFGVVILEVVTGRPPIDPEDGENDLVKWVSSALKHEGLDGVIDPTLDSKHREEISKVLSVGLHCTGSNPVTRPTMRKVVKMLREVTKVPKCTSVNAGNDPRYSEGSSHCISEV